MKWIKRFFIAVLMALVLAGIAGAVGYHMYHSKPAWYRPHVLTAQQRSDAHNEGNQTFLQLVSWAGSVASQRNRPRQETTAPTAPVGPITVTFSEEALNSFISDFPRPDDSLAQIVSPYLSEPRIVLLENQIIVAGDTREFAALSSAHFETGIDEGGQLIFRLTGIYAGSLPVPQSMLSDRMDRVNSHLKATVAKESKSANIDAMGLANPPASAVAMSRLFLNALKGGDSDPVLFIPCFLGNWHQLVPVKIDAVKVTEGMLSLTLSPMSAEEETAFLKKMKLPVGESGN